VADKHDKTHEPTPQRIKKAREEGNVFKSQEVLSATMLAVGFSVLAAGMPAAFGMLKVIASDAFISASTTPLNVLSVSALASKMGGRVLLILLPFLLTLMVTGIAVNMMQTGPLLSTKLLEPKTERLSPLKGLQRIFSAQGLFTTGKALLKILVVGPIAYFSIKSRMPEILMLHTLHIQGIIGTSTTWILVLLMQLILVLLFLSGVDFAYERWRYHENLKMSKQEVQDEQKQNEGDPQMKVRRRKAARDLVYKPRIDHAVMRADVVVTNPTHYAVALRYDPSEAPAPTVLVKGIRKRALRIKALALELGIPTIEDRPLARALYKLSGEMEMIPEELYPAVATILAELYRKQGHRF
jgi:flagellar biosynthetic protein FlhB